MNIFLSQADVRSSDPIELYYEIAMNIWTALGISALSGTIGASITAVTFVQLQAGSPGTAQEGHSNITGYSLASRFGAGVNPTLARVEVNESGGLQGVRSITTDTVAVYGQSNALTGLGAGGYFTAKSVGGRALVVDQISSTGNTVGGLFYTRSPGSTSIWGKNQGTTGTPVGVRGDTLSATGIGVFGTGPGVGGHFESTGSQKRSLTAGSNASTSTGIEGRSSTIESGQGAVVGIMGAGGFLSSAGFFRTTSVTPNAFVVNRNSPEGTTEAFLDTAASIIDADINSTGNSLVVRAYSGDAVGIRALGGGTGANIAIFATGNTDATGTKSFAIDHPLDPANSILKHYSEEGPEPYNTYRGNVKLDSRGEAWVTLPAYFGEINRDLTYQLTCVGGFANVYVATEVQNNRFKIAGGRSGMKVSWAVTGVRNDAYVRHYGFKAETKKAPSQRGFYLTPEAYGLPQSKSVTEAMTARKSADGTVTVAGKVRPDRP